MKRTILAMALMFMVSPLANAKNVNLEGRAAESFIDRHFPGAEVPGHVNGVFNYINKNGLQKQGYAECYFPAMGGRSNGVDTTCSVIY